MEIDNARPHGKEWKLMMINVGLKPDRCHNYETMDKKRRVVTKYNYTSNKCSKSLIIGAKHHNHLVRHGGKGIISACCRSTITFVSAIGKVNWSDARART